MSRIDPQSESKKNIMFSQSVLSDYLRQTSFLNVELHSLIHFLSVRGTGNDEILSHGQETGGTDAISMRTG
jgi:hypothetical protein